MDYKKDFPILSRKVHGKRLVYLDNAATSQKPRQVIDAITRYYEEYNSNIHRGIHALSEQATAAFEGVRGKVAGFIGVKDAATIIFTRGTTEAINLVAYSWGEKNLKAGDEIVLSIMEHHSNIVPWLRFAKDKGVTLKYVELTSDGRLDMDKYRKLLGPRVKLVTITHMSNVLGVINPIREITAEAHRVGATVLVDGAQSVPHIAIDVGELGCDFFAFSSHKMLGPTGVGVLWGRRELLETMEPFNYGGDMIRQVHRDRAEWNDIPWKFEAGTTNIADVIALGAAIDYLEKVGMDHIRAHEIKIGEEVLRTLKSIPNVKLYGPETMDNRGAVFSFNVGDIHAHDVGSLLDQEGVAIRAGHHCAMPLMQYMKVPATARASFYLYNTAEDIQVLAKAIVKAQEVFAGVPVVK